MKLLLKILLICVAILYTISLFSFKEAEVSSRSFEIQELSYDGCSYLVFIEYGNMTRSVIHKANCKNCHK